MQNKDSNYSSFHPIDIENWDRKEIYEHFSKLKLPHYNLVTTIDVTRLIAYKQQHKRSFYLTLIYLATQCLNKIENFRLRVVDGQVVSYDRIHTNFTHKTPQETLFHFYTAPFEGTLQEYVERTSEALPQQKTLFGGLPHMPNLIYFSCNPSIEIVAVSNPGMEDPEDAIPRVNWGKYAEHDGRWLLNLTITVNHRFIDGSHVGEFVNMLQETINQI